MPTTSTRQLRAFKRWMAANGIVCSDALELVDDGGAGIFVRSRSDLKEGDLVATIPKQACLTVKTSGACDLIESAELDGSLALSVALMYERSLGSISPWAAYLQLLPYSEPLPLLWTLDELDSLLFATELHKTVREDKDLIYSDWKECILPLIDSLPSNIDPKFFGVEEYFAAKSLVASRSFAIDDFYGSGMVPLADLFNHKTGAEHVHFTTTPSNDDSDHDSESTEDDDNDNSDNNDMDEVDVEALDSDSSSAVTTKNSPDAAELEEDPLVLEMILVKDVKAREEVFNTYGLMGNAALLHRYGFTEPDNEYDIVNIDLDLVSEWASSTFSSRHARARMSIWRRLGYSGCISQESEYFEISYTGKPQIELLILLYINLLPDETYNKLDVDVYTNGKPCESLVTLLSYSGKTSKTKASEMSSEMLLTKSVRESLLLLVDVREKLYGLGSLEDDVEILKNICCIKERKRYHSLMLRVSERRILEKLRLYAKHNTDPASHGRTSGRMKSKS
ncbi:hypothetical protein V2J09_009428 [Rumex salicifolius]